MASKFQAAVSEELSSIDFVSQVYGYQLVGARLPTYGKRVADLPLVSNRMTLVDDCAILIRILVLMCSH